MPGTAARPSIGGDEQWTAPERSTQSQHAAEEERGGYCAAVSPPICESECAENERAVSGSRSARTGNWEPKVATLWPSQKVRNDGCERMCSGVLGRGDRVPRLPILHSRRVTAAGLRVTREREPSAED